MLILRKDYFEPQFYFYYILISSFLASTWWSFSVTVSTGRNTYTNTNNPSKCWTQLLEIFLKVLEIQLYTTYKQCTLENESIRLKAEGYKKDSTHSNIWGTQYIAIFFLFSGFPKEFT